MDSSESGLSLRFLTQGSTWAAWPPGHRPAHPVIGEQIPDDSFQPFLQSWVVGNSYAYLAAFGSLQTSLSLAPLLNGSYGDAFPVRPQETGVGISYNQCGMFIIHQEKFQIFSILKNWHILFMCKLMLSLIW
jgi:hypothetical protein